MLYIMVADADYRKILLIKGIFNYSKVKSIT